MLDVKELEECFFEDFYACKEMSVDMARFYARHAARTVAIFNARSITNPATLHYLGVV